MFKVNNILFRKMRHIFEFKFLYRLYLIITNNGRADTLLDKYFGLLFIILFVYSLIISINYYYMYLIQHHVIFFIQILTCVTKTQSRVLFEKPLVAQLAYKLLVFSVGLTRGLRTVRCRQLGRVT